MNYSTIITLVDERVRVVNVKYTALPLPMTKERGKSGYVPNYDDEANSSSPAPASWSYKTMDQNLAVGDRVVVPLGPGAIPRPALAVVVEVDVDVDVAPGIEYKWVVQRVDFTDYDRTRERENEVVDVVRRAGRVRRRAGLAKTLIDASVQDDIKAMIERSK